MKIITDKDKAEELLYKHKNSILDSYGYKKILNDFYSPDKYIFMQNKNEIFPLVLKNNLVTFYGGMQHNHYNSFSISNAFLNDIISYLSLHKYDFRLLSLTHDYYGGLHNKNKLYDVPYPPTWIYYNIDKFKIDDFLLQYPRKKRNKLKNVLSHKKDYHFESLEFKDFTFNYKHIISLQNRYFQDRNLSFVWENNEDILFKILQYFNINENIMIRLCKKNSYIVGLYIFVYNDNELIYFMGSSFDYKDQYVSKLLYFDLLENSQLLAKKFSINQLDALQGGYSNKKRFKFTPKPLYGLVNDKTWITRRDKDLTEDNYVVLYDRKYGFGAEQKDEENY